MPSYIRIRYSSCDVAYTLESMEKSLWMVRRRLEVWSVFVDEEEVGVGGRVWLYLVDE